MRIGLDLSFGPPRTDPQEALPHPRGGAAASLGVARVVAALTGALEQRGHFEWVRLAPPAGAPVRQWRRKELPRAVRELGLAGLHSFTSSFPLRGAGLRVQTIHELPWRHGVRENAGLRHRLWAALGPLRADRVLCPTEFVAADLRRSWLPGAHKIRVCPWGVAAPFATEPPGGTVDEVVLGRYRLPEDPLIVCSGAVRAKKNLAALLHGLAEVRRRGGPRVFAVITGPETADLRHDLGLASQLGLTAQVLTPGVLPEADLAALLRLASAAAVLSHSEGFGLPVLEALACGTPVLVPPRGAAAEVAGDFGIRVDPAQPNSVADGILEALERREELRWTLGERAAEFTWDASAACVERAWSEIVS